MHRGLALLSLLGFAGCGPPTVTGDAASPRDAAEAEVIEAGPAVGPPVGIAAGASHTCAWTQQGAVWCWGEGAQGQLGQGAGALAPSLVPGLGEAQEVSAGRGHSCARLRDRTVWCWGDNGRGQLGDGTALSRSAPAAVSGLADAAQLAAGHEHSCARLRDGTARCWGAGDLGQLGQGALEDSRTPVLVSGLGLAVQLAAGMDFTCARRSDGTVWCWGNGARGRLGDGVEEPPRATPAPVGGLIAVLELAAGPAHACVRNVDGNLGCWGAGRAGQVGDGAGVDRAEPTLVANPPVMLQLAAGGVDEGLAASYAVAADGTLRVWGADGQDQLALAPRPTGRCTGSAGQRFECALAPQTPPALASVVRVAAGGRHACALLEGGALWCWGANEAGQLGDGTREPRTAPVRVRWPG